jgi:hypothetical protein
VIANKHIEVLIPPDSAGRAAPRPGWTGGRYEWMRTVLAAHGELIYRRRIQRIEPVFAHTKHNRTITRFHRRGRTAVAHQMATTNGDPKPHQAPPPPPRRHRVLKGPAALTSPNPTQPVHNGTPSGRVAPRPLAEATAREGRARTRMRCPRRGGRHMLAPGSESEDRREPRDLGFSVGQQVDWLERSAHEGGLMVRSSHE